MDHVLMELGALKGGWIRDGFSLFNKEGTVKQELFNFFCTAVTLSHSL
jgi:hypothetical protein